MLIATTDVALIPEFNSEKTVSISDDGRFVVYEAQKKMWLKDLATGSVSVVTGPQGATDNLSRPTLSGDGTKLGFQFLGSDNLIQIYVKDLRSGALLLASSSAAGEAGNKGSALEAPHFYGDGRFLTFISAASNLAPGAVGNGDAYVYLKDLQSGSVTRVTESKIPSDLAFYYNTVQASQDGQVVSFLATVRDPVNPQNEVLALAVKNLLTGSVTNVYGAAPGEKYTPAYDSRPFLSAQGNKVAYQAADHGIYVKDLQTGTVTLAASDKAPADWAATIKLISMSGDGRYVTYTDVKKGIWNQVEQVYLYQKDLQSGAVQLLNIDGVNEPGFEREIQDVSADGQHIAYFHSLKSPFGAGTELARDEANTANHTLAVIHTNGAVFNEGKDYVRGTAGADQLAGGNGDDRYWIDHAGDSVSETGSGGHDTLFSTLPSCILPDNVEDLVLVANLPSGSSPADGHIGIGNALNNVMISRYGASDALYGMDGNDVLILTYASGKLDGGAGIDTALFPNDNQQILEKTEGGWLVRSPGNSQCMLINIERVQFGARGFAFAEDTNAAQAYRIYQAAFNRAPDAGGLGFWIKQFDNGAQVADVAQGFMQSVEFQAMYGQNPGNAAMVDKFYQNVLHRAPDSGGLQYWSDILDNHRASPAQVLASFSESPENQAALVGVINAGLTFTPYA